MMRISLKLIGTFQTMWQPVFARISPSKYQCHKVMIGPIYWVEQGIAEKIVDHDYRSKRTDGKRKRRMRDIVLTRFMRASVQLTRLLP